MSDLWGILLAAGSATRFGSDKLTHPADHGVSVGVLAARHLLQALPNSVAVVPDLNGELATLLRVEGIGLLNNPDAGAGIATSIACAIRATPTATGWVIALADMPWISPESISGVAGMLRAGAGIAAPVYRGQRGHPVGFSHRFKDELLHLAGDRGARDIIDTHRAELQLFEVNDSAIVRDIDTPTDLERPPP